MIALLQVFVNFAPRVGGCSNGYYEYVKKPPSVRDEGKLRVAERRLLIRPSE